MSPLQVWQDGWQLEQAESEVEVPKKPVLHSQVLFYVRPAFSQHEAQFDISSFEQVLHVAAQASQIASFELSV